MDHLFPWYVSGSPGGWRKYKLELEVAVLNALVSGIILFGATCGVLLACSLFGVI